MFFFIFPIPTKMCDDVCPICLESLSVSENTLSMPVCGHTVHVSCALNAAQYDTRCPVCRAKDPSIVERSDDGAHIFVHFEELAARHNVSMRRYQRRRADVIRRHDSLKRMRDRLNAERRLFAEVEHQLERQWIALQRNVWQSDATIAEIRQRRKRMQRRVSDLNRRLNARLRSIIGDEPTFL